MNNIFILMKNEWMLLSILFILLFLTLGKQKVNHSILPIIQLLLFCNLIGCFVGNEEGNLFGKMYHTNAGIAMEKGILSGGVFLISLLFHNYFLSNKNLIEYFILMISSLLGMYFMISSNHLLMFYLSLELSTIPVAAMANFDVNKKNSSEAGIKMILSSAFSSALFLFGISILYGLSGSLEFANISTAVNNNYLYLFTFFLIISGLLFKLSVVPFHFWTADVFEGSPLPTTAFLSVISKGAVAFVLITFLYQIFSSMHSIWYNTLMILSVFCMLIGNIFALRQKNIKRFLAFSSISQVGYIIYGVAGNTVQSITSVIYFILIYIFSNLMAIAIAALVSHFNSKEKIEDFKGFYQTNSFLSWLMALALFSLAGIPPTAGFWGKLFLLNAGSTEGNYRFLIVAALNMVISLYYYLKIIRYIFIEKNEQPILKINVPLQVKVGLIICAIGIIFIGWVSPIFEYIKFITEKYLHS